MAYESFKPEILSTELMTDRERMSVFRNLCYKGPILGEITKMGDVLHIAGVGRPTVRDYVIGTDLALETKTSYNQDLHITQQKYINVEVEKIDDKQAAVSGKIFDTEIQEAKRALAQTADEFLAGFYTQAGNTVTDAANTSLTILAKLAEVQEKLLEADVPLEEEMILVISPRVYTKIVLAKIIFQNTNNDIMTKGFKGNVLNFNTYVSNSVQNNGSTIDYNMAFTRKAIAFAEQIPANMIKRYEPELAFSDAFKVLHLYGGTVIRPAELVCFTTTNTDEAS
jgi:hypothetical protein